MVRLPESCSTTNLPLRVARKGFHDWHHVLMVPADRESPMETIGKYRVVRTLGRGGMGEVYLAEDPDIGRRVAIKVLLPSSDEDARLRFTHEARTIGRLSHPHIVMLLEYGFHGEQPYLVLEYLEGTSLDRWLETDPPLDARLRVLQELALAVDYSHRHEVLHRDIKPTNLQILGDGHLKLLDFGIARSRAQKLTATGLLIGTPEYMAPEVIRDGDHSARSDVYAVGLVAYEVLTGVQPFRAQRLEACLHKILSHTPPPLGDLRPELPAGLSNAVMACLRSDPAERPEDLAWLEAELERAQSVAVSTTQATIRMQAESAAPTELGPRPNRRRNVLAGLAAVFVLALVGVWALRGSSTVPPNRSNPIAADPSDSTPAETSQEDQGDATGTTTGTATAATQQGETPNQPTTQPEQKPELKPEQKPATKPPPSTAPAPASAQQPQAADFHGASADPPETSPITASSPLVLLSDTAAENRREELSSQEAQAPSESIPPARRLVLTDLSPRSVRRGDSVSLRIEGSDLDQAAEVEVRRAGRAAAGFRVLRLHHEDGRLLVELQIGREVSLGAYTVHVGSSGPGGDTALWSEGLAMEVSL